MRRAAPTPDPPVTGRRSVLIVTDVMPGHRAAGEVRLARIAALLAEQGSVRLVALDRDPADPDVARIRQLAASGVEVIDVPGPTALRAALVARSYDLVILEFWHVAERSLDLVRARQPQAAVAVDTVDLHFLREERWAAVGSGAPAGVQDQQDRKRRELAVYEAVDARIFTSETELDRYTAATGIVGGNLIVSIIADPLPRAVRPRQPCVVFVGSFWHAPNPDGVRWFAERVWPAVRSARPDAVFTIAGSRIGPEIQRLAEVEGIEVLGFVEDLEALYDRACVAVAPLRFGAGVKGKVAEALAAGLPMVATNIATEGLGLLDGVDLLVADDAELFAAKLIRLLDDPEAAALLGANGQATIAKRCGPGPARAALRTLAQGAEPAGAWSRLGWWGRTLPDRAWLLVRPGLAAATRSTRRRFASSAP